MVRSQPQRVCEACKCDRVIQAERGNGRACACKQIKQLSVQSVSSDERSSSWLRASGSVETHVGAAERGEEFLRVFAQCSCPLDGFVSMDAGGVSGESGSGIRELSGGY